MSLSGLLEFFTDPILRAPTIGCMLMCLTAGFVGALVFLRKQSLIGETLSHASYPGIILGVLVAGTLSYTDETSLLLSILILVGASCTALLGLWSIHFLERRFKVRSDSALCIVLSGFFGIGITLASEVQFSYTGLYKQAVIYLYGQAATMTDIHIVIYGVLAIVCIAVLYFFYQELQITTFDRNYAKSLGIKVHYIDTIIFVLIVLAVVIGIRSVGVILISAMLIAPPVAARQFTNKLSVLFILSGLFGLLSGFLGNYFSVTITDFLRLKYPSARIILPTGPMIVIVASTICLFALLFAPKKGIVVRALRIGKFKYKCLGENLLKAIWRSNKEGQMSLEQLHQELAASKFSLFFVLRGMVSNGWLKKNSNHTYSLTKEGALRAAKIVRLHRLWEVYLSDYLGMGVEKVHRNAEEMEHIITPELEKELTLLLDDPKFDPHHQPIPSKEGLDVF